MKKIDELKKLLEEHDTDSDDSNELQPDPTDIFIEDVKGGYSVSADQKHVGEFKTEDEALQAVVDWVRKHKVHPSIWRVSDHGNADPYVMDLKYRKQLK